MPITIENDNIYCENCGLKHDIKKEMDTKDYIKQREIINQWIEDAQKAYGINDISDQQIISYLAQKEMGFHSKNES